jgi:flagella basal body P-ring formation protein FlgA
MAGGVRVVLKDAVVLDKATCRLGDLADISAANEAVAALLENVEVDVAPSMTAPVQISRARLARLVRTRLPRMHRTIRWEGAEVVAVTRQTVPYALSAVVDFAERALRARLEPGAESLTLQALPQVRELRVPSGDVTLRLSEPVADVPARRMMVPVDILTDGVFVRSVPAWFAVRAFQEALVATGSFPMGYRPTQSDFVPALVEVTAVSGLPEPVSTELAGQRLKRSVEAGGVLLKGYLEPAPAVARGEPVEFAYAEGVIRIEGKGRALADAGIGQAVSIRFGNETVLATVVGPGQVDVSTR